MTTLRAMAWLILSGVSILSTPSGGSRSNERQLPRDLTSLSTALIDGIVVTQALRVLPKKRT